MVLMSYANLALAEVKVSIEPSQISLGDTFTLTITQENFQGGGLPDLRPLNQDFRILGTQRSMNYTVINGQAQSTTQWVISLKPLKVGISTIPSLRMGAEQTNPLTINVEANAAPQKKADMLENSDESVILKTQVNEKKPYINQQVIYTVKLYNNKRLLDVDYKGPQAENAVIVPLGEAKQYQEVQNNATYLVEEQTYALFPQKSGLFKITSPQFSALIYDIDSRQVQLANKPIELNVQAIPSSQKVSDWLPAQQVTLTEYYENSDQSLSQGSTVTRVITLEGVAVPAQLLPTLDFKQEDAFNVYLEKGTEKNQVKQGNLVGTKLIKVTYLFNKAGKITIPELRLPWFNTQTGKEEMAILAPRSMDIGPVATQNQVKPLPIEKSKDTITNKSVSKLTQSQAIASQWAWTAALLFAIAWIITLILWLKPKSSRFIDKKQRANILNKLKKACSEGNPKDARDILLKWGTLQWPDAPILNLSDLVLLVRDISLNKQITLLSQVLYSKDGKMLWRGDELFRAISQFKPNEHTKQFNAKILPPINPD